MATRLRVTKLNHGELQTQVAQMGARFGWCYLHVQRTLVRHRGDRGHWQTACNHKGWPDMAPMWNVRQPGRILAVEIKVATKLTPEQDRKLVELENAGLEVFVFTQADLESGAVARAFMPRVGYRSPDTDPTPTT